MNHGTYPSYTRGCRCQPCREAATAYKRAWYQRAQSRPVPEYLHGTEGCYVNQKCRCEPCTAANTAAVRTRRQRARAKVAAR